MYFKPSPKRYIACLAVWLLQLTTAFVVVPRSGLSSQRRCALRHKFTVMSTPSSSANERIEPTPEELQAKAAALREEVRGLEASAAGTRRPKELVESQQVRAHGSLTMMARDWVLLGLLWHHVEHLAINEERHCRSAPASVLAMTVAYFGPHLSACDLQQGVYLA